MRCTPTRFSSATMAGVTWVPLGDITREARLGWPAPHGEDVRPLEGVAPRQDQNDWLCESGNIVDQAKGFVGGKLARIGVRLRHGAAMEARQVARPRHLPGDQARRLAASNAS